MDKQEKLIKAVNAELHDKHSAAHLLLWVRQTLQEVWEYASEMRGEGEKEYRESLILTRVVEVASCTGSKVDYLGTPHWVLRINVNAGDNCAVSLISLLYGWLAGVPGSCVIKHERAGVSEARSIF